MLRRMDAVRRAEAPAAPPPPRRAGGGFQLALAGAERAPAAARPGSLAAPWEAAPNPAFRARIAAAERSAEHPNHGYGQVNPRSGALGRYQFLPSTLVDLGWKDASGAWTARAGVRSDEEFLRSPLAQEAAFTAFLRRVETQLDRNGALARQGGTLRGLDGQEVPLTEGGLVAAAHRRGAGLLARWLQHRTETPDAPLRPAQRRAFEAVERRLRDFAQVDYASLRAPPRVPVAPFLLLNQS
ncbi:hypothetical protein ACI6QG_08900 [Roseococcus sp. DSY-14]|uniref:hypothetical protein n=1 Tax=Roseococcus sp. DSY-14 TaxID=3369650 RepID=UPI00387AEA75